MSPAATSPVAAGRRRHLVTLEDPGPPVADGDGGWAESWLPLDPSPVWAAITPATARDLERISAGTIIATASHVVILRYHPGVTTQTRITHEGRIFQVTGIANPEERDRELVLVCVEVVP